MSFDGRPYGINVVSNSGGVMVGSYPNIQYATNSMALSNRPSHPRRYHPNQALGGDMDPGLVAVWTVIDVAAVGLGVYHGYKRNHGSVGWAIGWGLFGAVLPILALPLMFAEGFAEPA